MGKPTIGSSKISYRITPISGGIERVWRSAVSLRQPMGISDSDQVDLVAKTKGASDYMLVLVVDEPWQDTDEFRQLFLDKLNNYCSYFLDGQIQRQYPDCKQSRIGVRIASTEKLPLFAQRFVKQLADAFRIHGLDIEAKELD